MGRICLTLRKPIRVSLLAFLLVAVSCYCGLPYRPVCTLQGPEDSHLVGFSPDGQMLATGPRKLFRFSQMEGKGGIGAAAVHFWDATTGQPLPTPLEDSAEGWLLRTLPPGAEWLLWDRPALATLRSHLVELTKPTGTRTLEPNEASIPDEIPASFPVYSCFSSDRALFAYGLNKGAPAYRLWLRLPDIDGIELRDTKTWEKRGIIPGVGGPIAFTPDGTTVAAVKPLFTGEDDQREQTGAEIVLFDLTTRTQCAALRLPKGAWVQELRFAPDGRWLAAQFCWDDDQDDTHRNCVRWWRKSNTWERHGHSQDYDGENFAFALEGKYLLTRGFFDALAVKSRDLEDYGQIVWQHSPPHFGNDIELDLPLSPNGTTLAVCHAWDQPSPLDRWPKLSAWCERQWGFPTSGWRRETHLISVASGRDIAHVPGGMAERGAVFSPDNRKLATIDYDDARVRVWDLPLRPAWGPVFVPAGISALVVGLFAQSIWRLVRSRRPV